MHRLQMQGKELMERNPTHVRPGQAYLLRGHVMYFDGSEHWKILSRIRGTTTPDAAGLDAMADHMVAELEAVK